MSASRATHASTMAISVACFRTLAASASTFFAATGQSVTSPRAGISSTRATIGGEARSCQHTSHNTASQLGVW
jgi:hypothetical protein